MISLLLAIGCLLVGGCMALLGGRSATWATRCGVTSACLGCAIGLWPTLHVLAGAPADSLRLPWPVPGGEFHVRLDVLSAFFLVPVFILTPLAAIYGGEYLSGWRGRRSLGASWFFFNLFVAGMALVLVARQALLFLFAWEVMSLAAFFLVTFEHEKPDVRTAGWVYLIATHLGTAFLLALFLLLGRHAGSLDFDRFMDCARLPAPTATAIFALALVGFGTKAGLVPLHVWLPEAHPAAPSHVSALMSGVMIKVGLYGILRTMIFLGPPAGWWGPALVVIGLGGALLGVALAMFQCDVKRVLAYSSIENIGLIVLALGVGVWGLTSGHPQVAALGLAGSLLHTWNHSLMKGLLFLGAGSILHGAGSRNMEHLGGLLQRMPRTGAVMVLGAVAIAGVPPLNGFVSEWLIYMALLTGGLEFTGIGRVVLLLAVGLLALVGGMAMICFVRLIGIVLLGEGRTAAAQHAHESSPRMTVPLSILAGCCGLAAVFPRELIAAFARTVEAISGLPVQPFLAALDSSRSPLALLGLLNLVIWLALAAVAALAVFLPRRARVTADATWGCGYPAPTARMQYTGHSFAELMVTCLFPRIMRPRTRVVPPRGVFPAESNLASGYTDALSRVVYRPLFDWSVGHFVRLRWMQLGKIHFYMMYFLFTLLAAFGWLVIRRWVMHE